MPNPRCNPYRSRLWGTNPYTHCPPHKGSCSCNPCPEVNPNSNCCPRSWNSTNPPARPQSRRLRSCRMSSPNCSTQRWKRNRQNHTAVLSRQARIPQNLRRAHRRTRQTSLLLQIIQGSSKLSFVSYIRSDVRGTSPIDEFAIQSSRRFARARHSCRMCFRRAWQWPLPGRQVVDEAFAV